jgi:hypothetical protein
MVDIADVRGVLIELSDQCDPDALDRLARGCYILGLADALTDEIQEGSVTESDLEEMAEFFSEELD